MVSFTPRATAAVAGADDAVLLLVAAAPAGLAVVLIADAAEDADPATLDGVVDDVIPLVLDGTASDAVVAAGEAAEVVTAELTGPAEAPWAAGPVVDTAPPLLNGAAALLVLLGACPQAARATAAAIAPPARSQARRV